nr:hypothetical protein [uncultured Mediterranean phage uvMED]
MTVTYSKVLFGDENSAHNFALEVAELFEKACYEKGLIADVSQVNDLMETVQNLTDVIEVQPL